MVKRYESIESTKKREAVTNWSNDMDDMLIEEPLNQEQLGQRIDGSFSSNAYMKIVELLNKHFLQVGMTREKVKARIRTLKKKFQGCFDVFKNGHLSGFAWNPQTCQWLAEDDVWERLIEKNKNVAEWKNKKIRNYYKLEQL